MKFGLEQHIIDKLIAVFEQHPKVDKALVFGSRAKGNYRPDSDIDIAIKGQDLNTDDIIAMSVAFEKKGITHKIDLINYYTIKEPDLKDHIDRVGIELYSRWVDKILKEIGCTFLSGYAFKSSDYGNIGIPLIKIGNIQNRNVTIDDDGDFVLEKLINEKVAKYLLSNNDVLIAMTGQGSVGRVGKLKIKEGEKALLNQRVGKFICDEKNINIDYLYYLLTSDKYQDLLFNTGSGSGQPNLSPELILATEIPWVNYKEQTAIATILSSLDDKIDLLHRQNKTLEELAETLFRQWFVEEAEESNAVRLGDVIKTSSGGTPSRSKMGYYQNGTIKWVKSKELQGSFIFDTEEKVTDDAVKNSSAKLFPTNTILIAMYGATVGEYAILAEPATCNQAVCGLIPNENFPYTFLFILTKSNKQNLIGLAGGSAQQNISQELIKDIEIPNSIDKIKEYHKIVEPYFQKIKSNQIQIRTLTQTRDALLPKLMSGEVRVRAGLAPAQNDKGQPQGIAPTMILNELGEIAYNEWIKLTERFTNFELDVFQIMPNHMHGIIVLNNVGATLAVAQNNSVAQNDEIAQNGAVDNIRAGASPAPTVSDIVGAYKSLVANGCLNIYKSKNETMGKLWQRNYHEHIIRNEQSYQTISNYIINNPTKWNDDKFYTK